MTPDGYVEGVLSLAADEGPMVFQGHRSNTQALAEAQDIPAARRLAWFNHGFMRAQVADGVLVLSDLRRGSASAYFFSSAVARREGADLETDSPQRTLHLKRESCPVQPEEI